MTDQTPELSVKDEQDLTTLLGDAAEATYNPVLRAWKEILSPANIEHGARITIPWANAIVGKYADMHYDLMPSFVDRYFDQMTTMAKILNDQISSDPDCLTWHTVEEDRDENRRHYIDLLRNWQVAILVRENDWDCTAPDAAAQVAALGEISQFFFGEKGLTGHLSAIGFEFTEDDQAALQEHLSEVQVSLEEGERE